MRPAALRPSRPGLRRRPLPPPDRRLGGLASRVARRADVALVYIAEAHARDEWPVGNPLRIAQPATTAERCAVARRLLRETAAGAAAAAGVAVYVDGAEEDGFDGAFRAWPTRFYALKAGAVRRRARRGARALMLAACDASRGVTGGPADSSPEGKVVGIPPSACCPFALVESCQRSPSVAPA